MEEKIGLFPELPPEERREVEDYVRRNPHLREAFTAVLRLDHALRHGRVLGEDPPSDEALAYVAVMHDVDEARMPSALRTRIRDVARRIDADAALRARYRALLRRRAELESESDMDVQLRRLMGLQPRGRTRPAPDPPANGPASALNFRNAQNTQTESGRDTKRDRLRRLATAAMVLAAAYALLFTAGRMMRPETERLARFDPTELALAGYEEVRGSTAERDLSSETVLYLEALAHLREAETSFLGLFPSFDADRLEAAAVRLRQVVAEEPEESFLAGEATFLLAKTELARGNVAEARRMLVSVAESGGRRSVDAARVLRDLEEQ